MMIDGVFLPPTQTRPLVLLRLPNSRKRTSLGGSGGLPGAGRYPAIFLPHRMFRAPPRSARTFPRASFLRKRPSQALVLTANGDSFIPEARPLEGVFKRLMLAGPISG